LRPLGDPDWCLAPSSLFGPKPGAALPASEEGKDFVASASRDFHGAESSSGRRPRHQELRDIPGLRGGVIKLGSDHECPFR